MERIDTTSETYLSVAKDGILGDEAQFKKILIEKINEIIDWINAQWAY